jgi:LysM repeat protein
VTTTRAELARYAAPVAFLLGVTVAVLLVRAGLEHGGARAPLRPPTAIGTTALGTTASAKPAGATGTSATTASGAAQYVTVQSGDSFYAIASRTGTTVAALEALNPGVSSTALHVGQKLRVK